MDLNELITILNAGSFRLAKHRIKRNADLVTVDVPVHSVRIDGKHILIHHGGKTARVKMMDLQTIMLDEKSGKITCHGPIIVAKQRRMSQGGGWYEELSSGIRLEFVSN